MNSYGVADITITIKKVITHAHALLEACFLPTIILGSMFGSMYLCFNKFNSISTTIFTSLEFNSVTLFLSSSIFELMVYFAIGGLLAGILGRVYRDQYRIDISTFI